MERHRHPASRWGLRRTGVVLLIGGCTAGHDLLALAGHAGDPLPAAYLLGLVAFVCCSAGSALLIHGHHLFDTVETSRRWRRSRTASIVQPPVLDDRAEVRPVQMSVRDRPIARPAPRRLAAEAPRSRRYA